MKKILFYMICSVALALTACNITDVEVTQPAKGRITINIAASGASFETRTVEDTPAEAKLEWVDVFFFKAGNDNSIATDDKYFYHERIDHSSVTEPHTLGIRTSEIEKGEKYYVDVIANSSTLEGITDVAATIKNRAYLLEKIESTQYIHMTGLTNENIPETVEVPLSFMMDGAAYIGDTETSGPIELLATNADASIDVELKVTLRRAAAKVLFNFKINTTASAMFESFGIKDDDNYIPNGSYYIDNLKYKALLLAEAENNHQWVSADNYMRTTTEIPYGDMLKAVQTEASAPIQTMQLLAYVYCHKWNYSQGSSSSVTEVEPSVIINLPVVKNDGSVYANNYYEISLDVNPTTGDSGQQFELQRNHYYVINATINALGGDNPQTSVELSDIKYEAYPWDEMTINVGGSTSAQYLTLNTYHLDMHNESVDDYTLKFASSSPIESITRKEAYYYNKYGQRIDVSDNNIKATAEKDVLTGGITVESPLKDNNGNDTHKNTIRYLVFEVKNTQGATKTFTVMQYPLVYITNQLGWYSYRSDFIASGQSVPTTYENISETNNIVSIGNPNGEFQYFSNNSIGKSAGFWLSKVDRKHTSSGIYEGQSNIDSYYWRRGSIGMSDSTPGSNARMYHVRITATSDDYTLGAPRLDEDGYTDSGVDNAKLVSLSFMIASELGVVQMSAINYRNTSNSETYLQDMKNVFGQHCKNYVETYTRTNSNGKTETIHLDDWRLPTEEELKIIMNIQGASGDNNSAIDYLLSAGFYYTASGPVFNSKNTMSGGVNQNSNPTSSTSVRCVRDAYDDKTPPVTTIAPSAQAE